MRTKKIKVGDVFGRLTVLECYPRPPGVKYLQYRCLCSCGNISFPRSAGLLRTKGATRSCGCLNREMIEESRTTHGHTGTPTYRSWQKMKSRCLATQFHKYPKYGGRGIKICDRWLNSFENFLADMGERPLGKTIDRIDVNGDYTPNNCRWATPLEQIHNRRRKAA